MAKVLVTGATGFTGKAVSRRLVEEGEQVVAFVRPTSDVRGLEELGVECLRVDIKNPKEVMDHFAEVSKVYHIAAAYRAEYADHDEFRLVNVGATRNLLEAAKRNGVRRFIHCSREQSTTRQPTRSIDSFRATITSRPRWKGNCSRGATFPKACRASSFAPWESTVPATRGSSSCSSRSIKGCSS